MNEENTENMAPDQQEPNGPGKDTCDLVLCYLTCPQDSAKAFVGAIMLTDYRARPLYFACVSPVRPTKMQRMLYGPTLTEHLKVDVIGTKLLGTVPQVPDVLFVDAPDLIVMRRVAEFPTAFLEKNEKADPGSGTLSTLRYDTGSNTADDEVIGQIMATLESYVDLVEPFARMTEALKEVQKKTDT